MYKPTIKMLKCNVFCLTLCVASGILLCVAAAEDQKCSINVTETNTSMESITLRVTTAGQECNFTVVSVDSSSGGTHCVEEPEENSVFQCQVVSLEPGTSYILEIQSMTDEEGANVTLQTSPSTVRGLQVSETSDSLGVSWQPGPGRTERFRLLLTDHVGVVRNLTLESTAKDYTVTDLVPGRMYNITMVTEAGGRQSTTSRQIQTAFSEAAATLPGVHTAATPWGPHSSYSSWGPHSSYSSWGPQKT